MRVKTLGRLLERGIDRRNVGGMFRPAHINTIGLELIVLILGLLLARSKSVKTGSAKFRAHIASPSLLASGAPSIEPLNPMQAPFHNSQERRVPP